MSFRRPTFIDGPQRITAWSYSRLKTYLQCPFKAKCQVIDKLKEPESPQQVEGNRLHKLLEDYLKRNSDEIPPELEVFGQDLADLRDCNPLSEHAVAFAEDLSVVGWFAKNAWLRVRFDVLLVTDDTAVVIDLKTGKRRSEDADQCELFAVAVMLMHPEVNEVTSELWYSKTGEKPYAAHHRADLEKLKTKWIGKASMMLNDTDFLPTPNGLCGWCHFRKDNAGPCRF